MTATNFPFNEITFIKEIMDEIGNNVNDDWMDIFNTKINWRVSALHTFHDNIIVINEYAGGVFEAIEMYENHYGDLELPKYKNAFYSRLAFISMYNKFYDTISDKINELDELSAADTVTDDDI